jgi:hypothetical protein
MSSLAGTKTQAVTRRRDQVTSGFRGVMNWLAAANLFVLASIAAMRRLSGIRKKCFRRNTQSGTQEPLSLALENHKHSLSESDLLRFGKTLL